MLMLCANPNYVPTAVRPFTFAIGFSELGSDNHARNHGNFRFRRALHLRTCELRLSVALSVECCGLCLWLVPTGRDSRVRVRPAARPDPRAARHPPPTWSSPRWRRLSQFR
eukprot:32681-Prymnesium_polylepis.3